MNNAANVALTCKSCHTGTNNAMGALEVMDWDNPRFSEFIDRLAGQGYCNFHYDKKENLKWTCDNSTDNKPMAYAVLTDMGLSFDGIRKSFEFFEEHGGFCDCEIVFNCEKAENEE